MKRISMFFQKTIVISITVAVVSASSLMAAEKPQIKVNGATIATKVTMAIWPDVAPGETAGEVGAEILQIDKSGRRVDRLRNVTKPRITVHFPNKKLRNGAAVVICPGGGYNILADRHEGSDVATWLNSHGVTAIVLRYRVPRRKGKPKHEAPLQDAQRAMSIVRSNSSKWQIDPKRIGILGFSAGGHLAATASTNFDKRAYEAADDIDKISCRPDFSVLVYPAYLVDKAGKLFPEIRVNKQTPPAFFVYAHDDRLGSENAIGMYLAMKPHRIPAALHVYSKGGHGFGMNKTGHPVSQWPVHCAAWMKSQGLLKAN